MSGEQQNNSRLHSLRPIGMKGAVMIFVAMIVVSAVSGIVLENGLAAGLAFVIFIPLWLVVLMFNTGKVVNDPPDWVTDGSDLIPLEDLPSSFRVQGYAVKDLWQSPARIEFANDVVRVSPTLGKEYEIRLVDVESVRFTKGMNGRVYQMGYGINFRMKHGAPISIAAFDIEPWRSLLTHKCKIEISY